MFAKLIPLSVHKSASIYSWGEAKLARVEVEVEVEDADLSRTALASLEVPAASCLGTIAPDLGHYQESSNEETSGVQGGAANAKKKKKRYEVWYV